MTKLEYTFKTDTLFKILFVKNPELLKQLVSELLAIPIEIISQFEITNPEMPPEAMGDKFCHLDISIIDFPMLRRKNWIKLNRWRYPSWKKQ